MDPDRTLAHRVADDCMAPWVRVVGLVVAASTLVRALAGPLRVTALGAAAPIAFLAFALVLSVRVLATDRAPRSRAAYVQQVLCNVS